MQEEDALRSVLREWEAPEPPAALDARVLAAYRAGRPSTLWERLWSFRVSVPAPVLALALVLLIAAGVWLARRPVRPAPPSLAAPAAPGYITRLETAGFQPVKDGEIRIIRSGVTQQ